VSNPGDDGDPAVSAAGGAADPATSAPEGTGDPPARAREGTGDPVVSARQEDIEAGFRRPARETPGLRSLARIRSGGMRLMRGRKSRIWLVLAIAGPGVVAANAGNDAAGIATYASAGSEFVYRTLFFMVLVTIALVLVQEMAVRLVTHTG